MKSMGLIWLCWSVGVAMYAFVTIPTWLFASMNRGTLWSLRDCVFDARRTGLLPDRPEVETFHDRLEGMILVLPSITALQVWWLDRHLPRGTEPLRFELPANCPAAQRRRFAVAQDELERIIVRHYLFGSWSGLLFVLPRHLGEVPGLLRRSLVRTWNHPDPPPPPDDSSIQRRRVILHQVEMLVPHVPHNRDDLIEAAG